ncbi:OmpA family protein [Thalassomonas viridans]|uniref:OmpA family protein n=1 Tax=Thalassomonas viridans TaxID=137584 RepID=A0AAF0C546_9GAMM|nr:OmpA family protein [Thalassomonas viridans]WDE02937.1 OmpA family protein [Thalassomonas viridans]
MPKSTSAEHVESRQDIEQIRRLILGKENRLVRETIKEEARNTVTGALTEALHDRQNQDGSIDKVLQPLVEDSVEKSVTHNRERLVSSLYPLVGSLVRKSVTAFLADFMEKTNQLIENSLTIKGLKWRIKAKQAGVSFAQYAASQTFVYRVEHILLIHRETGLLLNSVDLSHKGKSDPALISAMLTAINDFVGDSFLAGEDGLKEELQAVSTDNFNLLIKPGPSALVVAAVIGSPPQKVSDQLQLTLEEIHRLYINELNDFDGDNQTFKNSANLLRDCLLSEQKNTEESGKKIPWPAWTLLILALIYGGYQTMLWFNNNQLEGKIKQLAHQPGIIIKQLEVYGNNRIKLDILRDPDAITISGWFQEHGLAVNRLNISEHRYHSLDPEIIHMRARQILARYPGIASTWQNNRLTLSGALDIIEMEKLRNKLSIAGFAEPMNLSTAQLQLTPAFAPATDTATENKIKQQVFNTLVGQISSIQLDFAVASEAITPKMHLALQRIYRDISRLTPLAETLELSFGLLIIGSSDNTGNKAANRALSLQRAENTAQALQQLGLSKDKMYVTGLGQLDIAQVADTARKVMFNVIFIDKSQ